MTLCSVFLVILSAPYYFIGEKKSFEKVKFQKGSITLLPDKSRVLNPAPHTLQTLSLSLCWHDPLVTMALPLQG